MLHSIWSILNVWYFVVRYHSCLVASLPLQQLWLAKPSESCYIQATFMLRNALKLFVGIVLSKHNNVTSLQQTCLFVCHGINIVPSLTCTVCLAVMLPEVLTYDEVLTALTRVYTETNWINFTILKYSPSLIHRPWRLSPIFVTYLFRWNAHSFRKPDCKQTPGSMADF